MQNVPPGSDRLPRWNVVLRALREARGVTQDGWAAWLGYSRATVQRARNWRADPPPAARNASSGAIAVLR